MQLLIVGLVHLVDTSFILSGHGLDGLHHSVQLRRAGYCLEIAHNLEIETRSNITDSSYSLQLSGTLVDRGDTCIAVDALTWILKHEA